MIAQLQAKKIAVLENKLMNSYLIIKELLAGLDCADPEVRALTRDVGLAYMETAMDNLKFDLERVA